MKNTMSYGWTALAALAIVSGTPAGLALAQGPGQAQAEFPAFDSVREGLTEVVSTTDGSSALWDLWADKDSGRLLAVLPANYDKQLLMIACTVSGGDPEAGVMGPTYYATWHKINKQLALIEPNFSVRTDGDKQARDSTAQLYTGRVILATPIVAMKGNRPVIDLGAIATRDASKLFGDSIFGGYGPSVRAVDASLARLTKTKSFPENLIVEYEAPRPSGQLVRLTYAIGTLEGTPGFKPRKADPRIGYFYNWHDDYARDANQDVTNRYITRWNLEKRDPSLKLSPPKQPIVWYIEHTTPVKFRRYVREGIEMWNGAFEEVGIIGAVEVYQQDAETGAHMDIDPEDARYNFFRWNATDQGYAIGPSRANPETGEILDADVVWHQGLTRSVRTMYESLSDEMTENAFGPETLAWLDQNPDWDPRVRLASPEQRQHILERRALEHEKAVQQDLGGHDHPWAPWAGDPTNAACRIGNLLSLDMSLMDAALAGGLLDAEGQDTLDGLPEAFIGPMIRYISAHEVGHCLGLQHNMAASSIRTLEEINTPGYEGPTIGSVMDYAAANINYELGEVQGPYATPALGPYDHWAIAYGYGPEKDLDDVLARVGEPDLIFISQAEMSVGSDPRNNTWELGADNLTFAESRIALAKDLRGRLVDDVVDDGDSWAVARRRYASLLNTQLQSVFVASRWIGGSFTNNDFKGDPGDRAPIEDVPAEQQRRALQLIIDNTFEDDAYGLTPELIRHLGKEYWYDPAGMNELMADPSFTAHDLVGGVQAAGLTMVMNPTTLRRVYDIEYRAADAEDVLTLAELMTTVTDAAWRELADSGSGAGVSSFRRNLQREHVDRLITLALMDRTTSPSMRTISTLAKQELRRVDAMAQRAQRTKADPYTAAHLDDVRTRIAKAMDAAYVIGR